LFKNNKKTFFKGNNEKILTHFQRVKNHINLHFYNKKKIKNKKKN